MKVGKILLISGVICSMLTVGAFAVNSNSSSNKMQNKGQRIGMFQDNKQGKTSPLASLVTAGTLTQDQATAVETALKAAFGAKKDFDSVLDSLVKAGTITEAQATKIKETKPACAPILARDIAGSSSTDKKANIDNLGSTTTHNKQGPGMFQDNKQGKTSPLASLVTAGTLTQDQATAVETALKAAFGAKKDFDSVLDSLVKAGTITEAQATKIKETKPACAPILARDIAGSSSTDKKANIDNLGSTTTNNKQGPGMFQDNKQGKTSPLASLVTAGTLTQDQATAVETALKAAFGAKKDFDSVLDSLVKAGTITEAQATKIKETKPTGAPVLAKDIAGSSNGMDQPE